MHARRTAVLTSAALLLVGLHPPAARAAPPPGVELRDATIAMGFESKARCPDLLQADAQDGSAALVVLVVGPSGVPSQPSVKSSSGSESLDAAALSCVMHLRFLPAVRAGEGSAVASWQEIAWKWGRGHVAQGAPASGMASGTASGTATATGAAAGVAAGAGPGGSHPGAAGAEVRVCSDESGKLTRGPVITHSSGDPALDEAAVRVARSGAPYYRPAGASPVTGCAQLAITFEPK